MAEKDDGAWFAPKAFGIGSGVPIAWQGWALLGAYLAVVLTMAATLAERHPAVFGASVLILTAAFIAVAAQHTRGGWHWRWGGDK